MCPQDIVACTNQSLIMNICNVVACCFQDTTMSARQILVDLDLHAPTCRRSGVKSSSPAKSAA